MGADMADVNNDGKVFVTDMLPVRRTFENNQILRIMIYLRK
jgi:hypothetical protein